MPCFRAEAINGLCSLQSRADGAGGASLVADAGAQTRVALENMKAVLAEAGPGMEHVVKLTVFLKNMSNLSKIQEVHSEYFPIDPPASSTIAIS